MGQMSELDKLFSEYGEKKQREHEAQERKRVQEEELQQKTIEILETIVLPVLKEFSAEIKKKGHKSEIEERLGNYSYPNVELRFKPVSKVGNRSSYASYSKLLFVHTDSGMIQFNCEINTPQGKSSSYHAESGHTFDHNEITEDWVRSKTLSFIETVLNAA